MLQFQIVLNATCPKQQYSFVFRDFLDLRFRMSREPHVVGRSSLQLMVDRDDDRAVWQCGLKARKTTNRGWQE